MKLFLVGGLGFIGKRFIRKFSQNHDLVVYASSKCITKCKNEIDLSNVQIEEGLVEDEKLENIILKHSPDVVIHLAALTGLTKCHDEPSKAFKVNVYGTYNVVKSCIKSKSKLIFISSREVYGETQGQKSTEEDAVVPKNVYGITKMIGEQLIKTTSKENSFDYTILRLTNVYGPQGDQYGAQIIIKDAIKDRKIKIFGGKQKLNYVFIDDVIEVINLVLNNSKSSKQIFNVGSNDSIKLEDFANQVVETIGNEIKFEYHPMRDTETEAFSPNIEKLEKELGYLPKTSLEAGIKQTINWYSENNF